MGLSVSKMAIRKLILYQTRNKKVRESKILRKRRLLKHLMN